MDWYVEAIKDRFATPEVSDSAMAGSFGTVTLGSFGISVGLTAHNPVLAGGSVIVIAGGFSLAGLAENINSRIRSKRKRPRHTP